MQVATVLLAAEQMLHSLLLHNAEQHWHKWGCCTSCSIEDQ